MLTEQNLAALQQAIADADLDGWLLFDFHATNPVAGGMLQLQGMVTRRVFAWIPRAGVPVAITHAIEQGPWARWPAAWRREVYASWPSLNEHLTALVKGKRVAMEYSPRDDVPYLDRIPAGVLELVRAAGAEVVTSAPLVSRFYAAWNADHIASHERAAAHLARIAREGMTLAGKRARTARPMTEYELVQWILQQFSAAGLETDHNPDAAVGANAANPHYVPSPTDSSPIREGDLLLVDLWAREANGGVWADQTWMASLGEPSARARKVWEAVRDARDAALALIKERRAAGQRLLGGEVDDAARRVITERGFGPYFTHRTGHSMDPRDLHGSGPHIDNLESRDGRELVDGVAFSIEPGVYLPGELGVRSEVNVYLPPGGAVVTPPEIQRDIWIV
ncbi:MAG TPA: Xaa-Pro peptidase family protein [Gemmatimonadaceae bacterium]|jgi:Xaa-Pro aminopeptidase|nr:Xaa-Pro peptidase family protein [Gemmatimonadaceae bacterium]